MPKLSCPCGYVHNLSPIPDAGWITIRDTAYEQVVDAHVQQHQIAGHDLPGNDDPRVNEWDNCSAVITKESGRLYECPDCGRLMWSLPGDRCTNFKIYRPEDDS